MKLKIFTLILLSFITNCLFAQENDQILDYKSAAQKPNANFYEITKKVRQQFDAIEQSLKLKGVDPSNSKSREGLNTQFERWAYFWQDRVNADGTFPNSASGWINAIEQKPNLISSSTASENNVETTYSTWTNIGPNDSSILNGWTYGAGIGRVNVVKRSPLALGYMLAGTASGGVFKTIDLGNTWTPLTDQFSGLGISDIIFHPTNDQIFWVATGDYDASHMNSIGIMKTTNGGTIFTNPLAFTLNQSIRIKHLYLDPNFGTNNTIYCTATNGIYVSTDAGDTWTLPFTSDVSPANMVDLIKLGSDIFATDGWGRLFKSTSDIAALAAVYTPTPFGSGNKLTFSYSPNTPTIIYCLFQANPAFAKYTISTNTMSALSTIPNSTLADANGVYNSQGGYNQVITANPNNGNEIIIGEFSGKRSTDGGTTWANYLNGYYTNTAPTNWGGGYVHSDHHYIEYLTSDSLLVGNDGGVYLIKISTNSFKQCFNGLKATQSYSIAIHDPSPDNLMIGNQDNDGSSRVENGSTIKWYGASAGDGTATAISRSNSLIKYVGSTNGGLSYRTDGYAANAFGTSITNPNAGAFVWPLEMHITDGTILYGGFTGIYKMTGAPGGTFTDLGAVTTGTTKFINLANNTGDVAKQRIVVIDASNVIRKTLDETTWSTITPPGGAVLNSIYWSRNNNDTMFATASGYSAGNKIYFSSNAGGAWTNISDNMPNIVMKKILKYEGTDTIFVATELGVYFARLSAGGLVNAGSAWAKYSTGLPNVRAEDIEISYTTRKLYTGTFGRGVWVVDLRAPVDNYYSKSSGNLELLASWGSNTDGTGIAPENFTTTGVTYYIRNNTAPTIGANWTVSGTGSKIIVGDGTNACNFTIAATFTLTSAIDVSASGTLTLAANSNVTSGARLTLKSSATGTGKIAALGGGATITDNITTETYIPGGRRAYRFLSHPFSTTLNMGSLIDNIYVTGAGAGFDATTTNSPSAFWFDNAATAPGVWTAFTSTTDNNWQQYKGVRVLVRGDRNQPTALTGGNPTPNAVTLDMTGTVNTGNQTINLLSANNYHLVGNPYPSPVDIGTVINAAAANMGPLYWVWNANSVTRGAYVNISTTFGAYNLAMNGSFVVQPTASTTLAFTEGNKTSSATTNLFRGNTSEFLELQLLYENRHADNMFVRLGDNYKNEFDKMDGEKLFNPDINFYSVTKDSRNLSLDSRPFEKEGIIPLTITSTLKSPLKFIVLNNGISNGVELYLKDKLKNILTKLDEGAIYDFEITTDTNTLGPNRFEIVMQKIPVPSLTDIDISIYPNPTANRIWVNSKTNLKQVTIYSLNGVQLTYAMPNSKAYSFDMRLLPVGTYLVKTEDDKGIIHTQKVIRK